MRVLLVSGSTRAGSTNTAVLRTAPGVAPDGLTTVRYGGLAELPALNPDHDHDPLPRAVAELGAAGGRGRGARAAHPASRAASSGSARTVCVGGRK